MRLKSLELVGFKSFFETTTVGFASGITAVVGPNGCGKSNVVDAIRWVLGEQAPTRLRGKSTEDLIYAGNDQNPAAGMAEVSLVLEAEDSSLLPEPYSALSEVAVTRRVYRSGDSEYLLNKIPCRLKDITEFFMAAQIHSRGYSLIEQGKIEEIIQAKPHELRSMIEEAAGLSLFKGRREISERKLERVKENLARVSDVLSEIDRQLSYARRQAKKAEQYKIIRAELSELERLGAARRLIEQREALALETARADELAAGSCAARAHSAEAQSAVEQATAVAQTARADLAGAQRELQTLHAGAAERERTREFLTRRLYSIAELEPTLVGRLGDLETRATLSRAARAEAAARHAREIAAGGAPAEAALAELTAELEAAQYALKQSERAAEDLRDELSDLVSDASVIRGRLGDLTGERAELAERLDAWVAQEPAVAAEVAMARELVAVAGRELEACRAELASAEAEERQAREIEIEARAAAERITHQIVSLRSTLASHAESDRAPEGREAAMRLNVVLESMNGDRPATAPRWLRDVLHAPAELAPAMRAALGDGLDSVVAESPEFALRAIEILKRTQSGRLSFVQEPDTAVPAHPAIDAPGVAGRLLDMIEVEPHYRPVAEAMLGNVMVADDLNSALAASNLNGHGTTFVTRDGDLLEPGRTIAGGSVCDDRLAAESAHRIARDRAAAELERAEREHRELEARWAELRDAHNRCEGALAGLRIRVRDAERILGERRAALGRVEQSAALAHAQSGAARRRLDEIAQAVDAANSRLEELALQEQDSRARLGAMREEIGARRETTQRLGAAAMEAAARVEARKSEIAALERDRNHAIEAANQVELQIAEITESLDRARAERDEFEAELKKLAEQSDAARIREAELDEAVTRMRSECAADDAALEEKRSILKEIRERAQQLEEEAMQCNLRREHARTLSEELARTFAEKFDADFDAVAPDLIVALDGRDPAADDSRLAELRARAERIGEVNLAADSEVKELEERSSVLSAEKADLESAVNDLSQTITRLNREARKRFADTFEGAARNFEDLFPKLMRGGKGRLELTEATDVLEAGINILVQPAGKKVKEIALLSGGEKALSAMALVFSLFLLNPSPFCVMDEVDAPLDEFSLAQFTGLLTELKMRSQFIVITHNQRTMQRADQIHGVTMDRPGISKIISLKIPEAA